MSDTKKTSGAKRMRRAAKAEIRLLKREAAAEKALVRANRRLAEAESKLNDARDRVDRRTCEVVAAKEELRSRQESRALGPQTPAAEESGGNAIDNAAEASLAAAPEMAPTRSGRRTKTHAEEV